MPYKEIIDKCKEEHRCINCQRKLPSKYTFTRCSRCREKNKEYNKRYSEKIKKYSKYYRKNKEVIAAEREIREAMRVPLTNSEDFKEMRRIRSGIYYNTNKEKICKKSREYYKKNRDRMRKQQGEYYQANARLLCEKAEVRRKLRKEVEEQCQEKN